MAKNEKEGIFGSSEIGLWLDGYEDMFSSFDPRPLEQRALSRDFLDELKRASNDKEKPVDLSLLMPKRKRKLKEEAVIKKRLKSHFQKHYELVKGEKYNILKNGSIFFIAGLILMFVATYVLFIYRESSLLASFMVVLLEPGGWFLFWEGLDQIIFGTKTQKVDLEFYGKMSSCSVSFRSY